MKKLLAFISATIITLSCMAQNSEEIKPSALPKNVTTFVSTTFKKSTIERAAKVYENKVILGFVAYVTHNGHKMILVFDKGGNYISRARKAKDIPGILKPAKAPAQTGKTPTPPVKK
jgi:hypothetical protein